MLDLSGVVFRFDPRARLRALAAACDLAPQVVRARVWESGLSAGWDSGSRSSAAEVRADLRATIPYRGRDGDLDEIWNLAFPPDPEAIALLPARRDPNLVALTNNGPLEEEVLTRRHPEVFAAFGARWFTHRLGSCKPDPRTYRELEARIGGGPREITFLDDSPANVEAARAGGWRAVLHRSREDLARVLREHALEGVG
ncbi:MAG: HAD-IA family hydrolase [Solirubrobacteraceae bacterium]